MKLLRDEIVEAGETHSQILNQIVQEGRRSDLLRQMADFRNVSLEQAFVDYRQDSIDFQVLGEVARHSKTVLFKSSQVLALRPALSKFQGRPFFKLPFPAMILQFDEPIPEAVFFKQELTVDNINPRYLEEYRQIAREKGFPTTMDGNDTVLGIVVAENEDTCNAFAFFGSRDIQRVAWKSDSLDFSRFIDPLETPSEHGLANKRQLQLLSMACLAYLNCKNIELEKIAPDPAVNRKRANKGKRPLPEYYVTRVVKTKSMIKYEEERDREERKGTPHGHRYDVAGHLRQLEDGVMWIPEHQRGLRHEHYIPKVRKVNIPDAYLDNGGKA